MEDPGLSYVMTTRNKLPMLRVVLSRLIEQRLDDEEIVVVDAGSTDGTVEFVADLLKHGLIQQFSSQPDSGEAHGLNRGLLMATGRLIKVVSDDDAYYWPGLNACKRFMLRHDEIDILGSNGWGTDCNSRGGFVPFEYDAAFSRWRADHACFEFCGLGLMIRRASLSLLGLFNPAFVRVDMEFTLRVTQGPAKLAWHLGHDYAHVLHNQSNSITRRLRIADEDVYEAFHKGATGVMPRVPEPPVGEPYHQRLRSAARRLLSRLSPSVAEPSRPVSQALNTTDSGAEWREAFENAEKWLAEHSAQPGEFLV